MGNKLIEEWKARNNALKDRLRFVIAALTDKDRQFTLMAYNGLKQRALMLNGVGMGDAEMKKIQLIKRLTNQGYNLQVMAANALQEFLVSERDREERERLEFERQQREKDRILRRVMDGNVRMMGVGFRQALQFTEAEREKERVLMAKQRGIMKRMVDSNVRLMGAGYNKLIEEWKARQGMLKDKLKFVIKTLTDKDAQMSLMAFNGLKQRALMLSGVGMGDAQMKKIALIKRLTNQGFNLQCMAVNQLFDFLESEREREEQARLEYERQQKEKDRILRRIMDSNVRLMSAGFNKLIEEWKARNNALKEKLRFVIAALTDKDKQFTLMAYNGLKQRMLMLNGVGFADDAAQKLKIRLIRKLTDTSYNLQVMAIVCVKEFLKEARIIEDQE